MIRKPLMGLLVAVGLLGLASTAMATKNAPQLRTVQYGVVTVAISLPSMATSALDTSYVDISDGKWTTLPGATPYTAMPLSIGAYFVTALVDSVNTGISVGTLASPTTGWLEIYSLNNINSNPTAAAPFKALAVSVVAPILRVIVRHAEATTTGYSVLYINYPIK
jgi:hypothetical protein